MESMNNNQNFDNTVSGVERVSKKKGKKVALISGISVLAIAGGGVAAYNLSDYVKNQINLRIMKPEKYCSWVIEENSKEFASKTKDSYAKMSEKANDSYGTSLNLKYNISDVAKDLALKGIIGDDYRNTADDEEKILIDIFDNINEIALGTNISANKNSLSGNIYASLNGESLITSDMAIDVENFDYFIRVPELNEQWLCLALGNLMGDEVINTNQNIYELITPEELEDIIIRYTNIWNESVSDIEIEKKENLDICDISVEYTVISTEFDKEKSVELATNLVNELKNDDVIKNIVVNQLGEYTEDEYNSAMDEMLEEIKNSESDVSFTLNTYVDPNGDIRGVKMFDDNDEIFFGVGKDGDNIRAEFTVSEDGTNMFSTEFSADKDGNKYDGNIDITVNEYDEPTQLSIEFKNYEVVNEENGFFNADITFIIPEIDPIALDFKSDGNSQDISYNINIENTDYGTVTLNLSEVKDAEVSVPSKDGSFICDLDSDFYIEDYIPQENMQTFIENVMKKIGFSDELSVELAKDILLDIYSQPEDDWVTYDYDYDYEDEDIYNFDDYSATSDYDDLDSDFSYDATKISEEITESEEVAYDSAENYSQEAIDWSLQQTDEYQEIVNDIEERAYSLRESVE